ncbi:MAG: hypothetical protein AAFO61_06565 [Pseudomonadota bacterium]
MKNLFQRLCGQARAFARDDAGVNLVEFAIAAPFLLALLLGTSSFLESENASTTVGKATATVSDLISQAPTVDQNAVKDAFAAARYMTPSKSKMLIYVAGIQLSETDGPVVLWAVANDDDMDGLALPAPGSTYDRIPNDLKNTNNNSFVVVTHGYMEYEPLFGARYLPGGGKIAKYSYTNYFVPRVSITTLCDACEQDFSEDG